MKNFKYITKHDIVDLLTHGIIQMNYIDPEGKELVSFFGDFTDETNTDAISRFIADNLDDIREKNPSEYYDDHLHPLMDRIRDKLDTFQ